ncbi:ATP synthase mitochondrial F1 complex assembly factor 1 isoform 2-T2 [Aulostomus maculatus]
MWDDGKMAAALVQMSCWYRGMLAVRTAGIRPLIPGLVPPQFRTFSMRKDPELEENPFYSRYQDKIQKLRSTKPEEFKTRLEKRQEIKQEQLGRSKQAEFVRLMEQEMEKRDKMATSDGASGGFTRNKTLGSILNLEMIQDKTALDELLFHQRHRQRRHPVRDVRADYPPLEELPDVPVRIASEGGLRVLRGSVVRTRAPLLLPHQHSDAGRERSQSADPLPLPGPPVREGRRPHDSRVGPQVHYCPPGSVLGQSGAAVLRNSEAGDVPIGGDV